MGMIVSAARSPSAAGPTLVQYGSFSNDIDNNSTLRLLPLCNAVRSGNGVLVVGTCRDSQPPSSITDDQSNTYTIHVTQDNAGDGRRVLIAFCANVTNAPRTIRVNANAPGMAVAGFHVSEWCNLATSSTFNVSNGASGTSNAPSPGSVTTTTANELVISVARKTSGEDVQTWTKGSGQTLLMADLFDGLAVQYSVKAAAGSITPTFGMDLSAGWVSAVATFKSASAGTPRPSSGALIIGQHHQAIRRKTGTLQANNDYSAGNYVCQVPCFGSFLQGGYVGVHDITGITDTSSNTWSATGASVDLPPGQGPVRGFRVNTPTVSDSLKCTLALTNTGQAPGDTIMFYDCQNVDGTSLVHAVATGTQNSGTTRATASVTPPAANGIVFSIGGHGDNTTLSVSSPYVFDTSTDPNEEVSPWPNDNNNSWGHHYNTSTAASQATYTSDGPVGDWVQMADAYGPA